MPVEKDQSFGYFKADQAALAVQVLGTQPAWPVFIIQVFKQPRDQAAVQFALGVAGQGFDTAPVAWNGDLLDVLGQACAQLADQLTALLMFLGQIGGCHDQNAAQPAVAPAELHATGSADQRVCGQQSFDVIQ